MANLKTGSGVAGKFMAEIMAAGKRKMPKKMKEHTRTKLRWSSQGKKGRRSYPWRKKKKNQKQ